MKFNWKRGSNRFASMRPVSCRSIGQDASEIHADDQLQMRIIADLHCFSAWLHVCATGSDRNGKHAPGANARRVNLIDGQTLTLREGEVVVEK